MSAYTYKCPNCDAELLFRPESGDFGCEYCGSCYSKAELDALATAKAGEEAQKESERLQKAAEKEANAEEFAAETAVYRCPSCGAELIADKTTAATFCFYCHSPVMLTSQLTGDFRPDKLIPFSVDKKEVKERFLSWCKTKKFIKKDFFDASQLEKISGVYFPFWVVDSHAKGRLSATGTKLRVWRVGDTEFTETKIYDVKRAGDLFFNDMTVKALSREDVELLNGLYPYETEKMVDFSMPYLSGFLAEKRDIEKEGVMPEIRNIMEDAAKNLLLDTAAGVGSLTNVQVDLHADEAEQEWLYCLLPAWMLTYDYKGEKYYYAMNGQTGKIAGRVPVSGKKLALLFAGITAACTLLGAIMGGI